MDLGRVEESNGSIIRLHEERDFSAAENDGLGTRGDELAHDAPVVLTRRCQYLPETEFLVDDAMNKLSVCRFGHEDL